RRCSLVGQQQSRIFGCEAGGTAEVMDIGQADRALPDDRDRLTGPVNPCGVKPLHVVNRGKVIGSEEVVPGEAGSEVRRGLTGGHLAKARSGLWFEIVQIPNR